MLVISGAQKHNTQAGLYMDALVEFNEAPDHWGSQTVYHQEYDSGTNRIEAFMLGGQMATGNQENRYGLWFAQHQGSSTHATYSSLSDVVSSDRRQQSYSFGYQRILVREHVLRHIPYVP